MKPSSNDADCKYILGNRYFFFPAIQGTWLAIFTMVAFSSFRLLPPLGSFSLSLSLILYFPSFLLGFGRKLRHQSSAVV